SRGWRATIAQPSSGTVSSAPNIARPSWVNSGDTPNSLSANDGLPCSAAKMPLPASDSPRLPPRTTRRASSTTVTASADSSPRPPFGHLLAEGSQPIEAQRGGEVALDLAVDVDGGDERQAARLRLAGQEPPLAQRRERLGVELVRARRLGRLLGLERAGARPVRTVERHVVETVGGGDLGADEREAFFVVAEPGREEELADPQELLVGAADLAADRAAHVGGDRQVELARRRAQRVGVDVDHRQPQRRQRRQGHGEAEHEDAKEDAGPARHRP